jgi:asparagine synthase (glutamine-hydrolysing)
VLLSGGLDSTILASLAAREVADLASYAAGAAPGEDGDERGDLHFGREVAAELGLRHTTVTVDREGFAEGWARLIDVLGVPLCTPNEVAILALAERLRADGHVVAIGGEGADELFAGYEAVMLAADEFERARPAGLTPARFQLESTAWVSPAAKAELLAPGVWSGVEHDALLIDTYEELFARGADEAGPEAGPVDAHLRFLRRHNLAGLLQRLDTATMVAGVEGRTPFADRAVAELAEALPMAHKFDAAGSRAGAQPAGKLVLRRAFAGRVPAAVRARAKASFPLPFQRWLGEHGAALVASPFARALFRRGALETVAADPAAHWSRAWPMMNLARWGDRWWA